MGATIYLLNITSTNEQNTKEFEFLFIREQVRRMMQHARSVYLKILNESYTQFPFIFLWKLVFIFYFFF